MHEPDSDARLRAEAIVSMNVLATRLLFSPYWNKELRLPSLSVDNSDQFSAVQLANVQVPDSLTAKISKT